MKLRQYEGNHWQFQQLDLATIRSLTPRNELLQPLSWQVTGGLERVPGKHDDETLVSHVNGGGGGTWQLGDDMLGFALGTVRVEHNNDFAGFISPAAVSTPACCGKTRWAISAWKPRAITSPTAKCAAA
jgi:hypothetical protein